MIKQYSILVLVWSLALLSCNHADPSKNVSSAKETLLMQTVRPTSPDAQLDLVRAPAALAEQAVPQAYTSR